MATSTIFFITDEDKEWVHACFTWLKELFGYPHPVFSPILFTEEFFPNAIRHKATAIEPLVTDLCDLFDINPDHISWEIEEDIRDTHGTPYELNGVPFECDLEVVPLEEGVTYKLYFAKYLLNRPKRLVFVTVLKFIQISLATNDEEENNLEKDDLLFYLVGIYTGWGVVLSQTMNDTGREYDGFWERSWKIISSMPIPVMAYSLALHSDMIEERNPAWKKYLPADVKAQYEKAASYIAEHGNPAFNKQELTAKALFIEAQTKYSERDFTSSIDTYQKVIFLTEDAPLLGTIYNNIGYNLLWLGEYQKSIEYFRKAFEILPGFGYAYDNIGFAFIMLGDTDSGKHYITIASQTGRNDKAYSYRNLALYHQKRNEAAQAKENFQKAIESITQPVDFLEYYYARFLFEQGETAESMLYLKKAVEKNELLAIEWMSELKKSFK